MNAQASISTSGRANAARVHAGDSHQGVGRVASTSAAAGEILAGPCAGGRRIWAASARLISRMALSLSSANAISTPAPSVIMMWSVMNPRADQTAGPDTLEIAQIDRARPGPGPNGQEPHLRGGELARVPDIGHVAYQFCADTDRDTGAEPGRGRVRQRAQQQGGNQSERGEPGQGQRHGEPATAASLCRRHLAWPGAGLAVAGARAHIHLQHPASSHGRRGATTANSATPISALALAIIGRRPEACRRSAQSVAFRMT